MQTSDVTTFFSWVRNFILTQVVSGTPVVAFATSKDKISHSTILKDHRQERSVVI